MINLIINFQIEQSEFITDFKTIYVLFYCVRCHYLLEQ